MPLNRWIEHIRKFARENNMTYSCALSDPNLKDGYIPAPKRMGKRATAAAVAERESLEMGAEDINRAKAKKAPAKKAPAKKAREKKLGDYPALIDAKVRLVDAFFQKVVRLGKEIDDDVEQRGYKLKDEKKWDKMREKLEKEYAKIIKIGQDRFTNLYPQEGHKYFLEKYGDRYRLLHPQNPAFKDPYWGDWNEKFYDKSKAIKNRIWDISENDRRKAIFWKNYDAASAERRARNTYLLGTGRRLPMEDNFFYPARDRDRRYDMIDYSRVVPHSGGFRMTTSF